MTELKGQMVPLIETFTSFQGEGPDSGRRMFILRFKYCNRKCPYCDTMLKMRISQEAYCDLSELQEKITEEKLGIMVTGGEPTIKKHFNDCVKLLNLLEYPLANVETNGYNLVGLLTEADVTKNIHFIYSPKIFNEADLTEAIDVTKKVHSNNNVFIKVVFEDTPLIHDFLDFATNRLCLNQKVYLMPEGDTTEKLMSSVPGTLDAAEKYKVCFSNRDHILFNFI